MDRRDLAQWRMRNLGLTPAIRGRPDDVVQRLGAVQSQDFAPGKWSVGQRATGIDDSEVSKAFDAGYIVRTHVLRPTWHFVRARDIRWMLELTGPRVLAKVAGRYRQLGLHEELLARCRTVLRDALADQAHMTRAQLRQLLHDEGVPLDENRPSHILGNAELHAVICSGPVQGKQQTYALLEERCPQALELSADEALTELIRRYFTSHGPATLKDFNWWSGLPLGEIRRGLALVPEVETLEVEGLTYHFIGPPRAEPPSGSEAHLLQTFDEYVVGYTESRHLLDLDGRIGQIPDRTPGIVVLDTQVVAHWRRKIGDDHVAIEVTPVRPLKRAEVRSVEAAAQRFGEFLGLEPRTHVAL